jgi:hypothetical protein
VLARWNATTPKPLIATPTTASAVARTTRPGTQTAAAGKDHATSHISEAVTNTKTTGGTLNSMSFVTLSLADIFHR